MFPHSTTPRTDSKITRKSSDFRIATSWANFNENNHERVCFIAGEDDEDDHEKAKAEQAANQTSKFTKAANNQRSFKTKQSFKDRFKFRLEDSEATDLASMAAVDSMVNVDQTNKNLVDSENEQGGGDEIPIHQLVARYGSSRGGRRMTAEEKELLHQFGPFC